MIATVMRHELRSMLREGRFVVLTLCLAALLASVLAAAVQRHEHERREKDAVATATRQQWDAQGDKHPHRGAHFGLYVFRPDTVLAALEPGLTPYLGQALWLEPHRRNMARYQPAADELPSTRLGRLDAAFVLTGLMPLLIIALCFDGVSRERETGSLRMLHGIGLAPLSWAAGKWSARLLGFGLLAATPLATALIAGTSATVSDTDVYWRAALLSAAYLVYYALLVALALAVSTCCRSSRAALYVLVGLWLAFVLVMPRAAAAVADRIQPLPSAGAFWAAIQRDYADGLPGDGSLAERGRRLDADLLRTHGVARVEDLPVGVAAVRRLARDAYADRVHALHFDALWDRYAKQEQVVRLASALSPAIAMRSLAMKLAGTDLSHQRHFEDAAERYRRTVNTAIDQWDAGHTRGLTSFEDKYAGEALWRSIAPLSYQAPAIGFALRAAVPEMLVLAGWAVIALVLLGASVRRLAP
jgi:ABC-2 type transport system permease protein